MASGRQERRPNVSLIWVRPDSSEPGSDLGSSNSQRTRHALSPEQGAPNYRMARLATHRPSACSGVKALRNTSYATAARRRAPLAFRSLDPFRALRDPERRRRDEERPFRLRTKNWLPKATDVPQPPKFREAH